MDAVQAVVDTYEDGSAAHSNLPQNEEGDEDDDEVHRTIHIHTYLRICTYQNSVRECVEYIESRLSHQKNE